jgi:acyl-CoA synthetase (AMP-forming)/AMP-acid ligase II
LPAYQVPVDVHVTDSIPRNAAMKVLRGQVRNEYQQLQTSGGT